MSNLILWPASRLSMKISYLHIEQLPVESCLKFIPSHSNISMKSQKLSLEKFLFLKVFVQNNYKLIINVIEMIM